LGERDTHAGDAAVAGEPGDDPRDGGTAAHGSRDDPAQDADSYDDDVPDHDELEDDDHDTDDHDEPEDDDLIPVAAAVASRAWRQNT
ncbi:hypothetical protein ABT262_47055, partial [Amycolatopsis mediterranei]